MKTVKVRVAVAVDPEGNWCASGWDKATDGNAMSSAVDTLGSGEARYWLNVELPVPEVKEIQLTEYDEDRRHQKSPEE